jgi:hypothetical protein
VTRALSGLIEEKARVPALDAASTFLTAFTNWNCALHPGRDVEFDDPGILTLARGRRLD